MHRQHIKKQRQYFACQGLLYHQTCGFSSSYDGCESWNIKKNECRRIDAFELWGWRRFLRVPWTARRSNQSILKEISPEYSFKGLVLKLKIQYYSHLMWGNDSLEKTVMLGKIEGRRERGWKGWGSWMVSLMSLSKLWVLVMDREDWHAAVHRVAESQTQLSDRTDLPAPLHIWELVV